MENRQENNKTQHSNSIQSSAWALVHGPRKLSMLRIAFVAAIIVGLFLLPAYLQGHTDLRCGVCTAGKSSS